METSCLEPSGLDSLTLFDYLAMDLYICFHLLQKEPSLISQGIYLFIFIFNVFCWFCFMGPLCIYYSFIHTHTQRQGVLMIIINKNVWHQVNNSYVFGHLCWQLKRQKCSLCGS